MADSISIKDRKFQKRQNKLKGKEVNPERQEKNTEEIKDMANEVNSGSRSSKIKSLSEAKKKEMLEEYEKVIKKLKELELRNKKKQDFKYNFKGLKYFTTLNGHSVYSESMQSQAKADKDSISAMMAYGQLGAGFEITFEQFMVNVRPERRQEFLSLCKNNSTLSHNLMGMGKVLQFYNQKDFTRAYAAMVFFGLENNMDLMETFLKVKFNADFKQQIDKFKTQIAFASAFEEKEIREEAGTNVFSQHDSQVSSMQSSATGQTVGDVIINNAQNNLKPEKIFSSNKQEQAKGWIDIFSQAKELSGGDSEKLRKEAHRIARDKVEAEIARRTAKDRAETQKIIAGLESGTISHEAAFGTLTARMVTMSKEEAVATYSLIALADEAKAAKGVNDEFNESLLESSAAKLEDPEQFGLTREEAGTEAKSKVIVRMEELRDVYLSYKKLQQAIKSAETEEERIALEGKLPDVKFECDLDNLLDRREFEAIKKSADSTSSKKTNIKVLKALMDKRKQFLEEAKANGRYNPYDELYLKLVKLEDMIEEINKLIHDIGLLNEGATMGLKVDRILKEKMGILILKPEDFEHYQNTKTEVKVDNTSSLVAISKGSIRSSGLVDTSAIVADVSERSSQEESIDSVATVSESHKGYDLDMPQIDYLDKFCSGGTIAWFDNYSEKLESELVEIVAKLDNLAINNTEEMRSLSTKRKEIEITLTRLSEYKGEYIKKKEEEERTRIASEKEEKLDSALKTIDSKLRTNVGGKDEYIDELKPEEIPERLTDKVIKNIVKKVYDLLSEINGLDISNMSKDKLSSIKDGLRRSTKLLETLKGKIPEEEYVELMTIGSSLANDFETKFEKHTGADELLAEVSSITVENVSGKTGLIPEIDREKIQEMSEVIARINGPHE